MHVSFCGADFFYLDKKYLVVFYDQFFVGHLLIASDDNC